jgi:hypothetical protein
MRTYCRGVVVIPSTEVKSFFFFLFFGFYPPKIGTVKLNQRDRIRGCDRRVYIIDQLQPSSLNQFTEPLKRLGCINSGESEKETVAR